MATRQAVFAGSWYPAGRQECKRAIEGFLKDFDVSKLGIANPVAGIVPHAGWYFSGELACRVIRALAQGPRVDLVLLFGMHLGKGSPRYLMPGGAWETPLGPLAVAEDMAGTLCERYDFTIETTERFVEDNTIELQLPFIKYLFPSARILAMGLPPEASSLEIAESAVALAKEKGLETRVIGSTDLTHYGPNYGFTSMGRGAAAADRVRGENDRRIVEAMLSMDPRRVMAEAGTHHNACCAGAAASAIAAAKALGASRGELLAYTSSYDKSPGESFVGYAGIVF